jgi:histidinol-phosphate phosphatase family protein
VGRLRSAVFLDRDGTLNVKPAPHEYVRSVDEFSWLPGAVKALGRLARAGYVLTVVSNQRGIARGLVTWEALRAIEARIQHDLAAEDCSIAAFRYCPHELHANCPCRKPRPGMMHELAETLSLDLARSWAVGDCETDVEAGRAAGCRTALVGQERATAAADVGAPTLGAVASAILGEVQREGSRSLRSASNPATS